MNCPNYRKHFDTRANVSSSIHGFIGYIYDAAGQRVAKGTVYGLVCGAPATGFTLKNQYLLGLGGEQVTELDGSSNWVHSNVWAGGRLVATYDSAGVHFAFTDPLGTKRRQANSTGTADDAWCVSSAHCCFAESIWRRLLMQAFCCEVARALTKFGIAIAASKPMMATTIMISTSVKPA